MKTRIPSTEAVAELSRDAWEDLVNIIVERLYCTHRVEDRRGKGNGLDAWRRAADGIEGWQFRRLDGRLGTVQAGAVKDSISLAADRCASEMKSPLLRYTLVVNIDAEPGHLGSQGEIERLEELRAWAKLTHGVEFDHKGVTWVRCRLLENPGARPDLFEDPMAALAAAKDDILSAIKGLQRFKIGADAAIPDELRERLRVLLTEGTLHYQRGHELQSKEEYALSLRSLDDAVRLLEAYGEEPALLGQVLALKTGVCAIIGRLEDGISAGRRAVTLLEPFKGQKTEHYLWAQGNLALVLEQSQQFDEAERLFRWVLVSYEDAGSIYEIARTTQLLLELAVHGQKVTAILELLPRVHGLGKSLLEAMGPNEVSLGILGTMAKALLLLASRANREEERHQLAARALGNCTLLNELAEQLGERRLAVYSKVEIASCHWRLDQMSQAAQILGQIVKDDDPNFPGAVAKAQFNRAHVLHNMGQRLAALEAMEDARQRFRAVGDYASSEDASRDLLEFRGFGTGT